jgi:hypothetical protein
MRGDFVGFLAGVVFTVAVCIYVFVLRTPPQLPSPVAALTPGPSLPRPAPTVRPTVVIKGPIPIPGPTKGP